MRNIKLVVALMGMVALACGGRRDKDEGDDSVGDDSGGGGDDGVKPEILEADAWCALNTTGEQAYYWWATFAADDPQGTDTMESFLTDGLLVMSGDTVVSTQAIVVAEDGSGSTYFSEDSTGVSCSSASSYTFVFAVEDEDGNRSDDFEIPGRQGTDANGR